MKKQLNAVCVCGGGGGFTEESIPGGSGFEQAHSQFPVSRKRQSGGSSVEIV